MFPFLASLFGMGATAAAAPAVAAPAASAVAPAAATVLPTAGALGAAATSMPFGLDISKLMQGGNQQGGSLFDKIGKQSQKAMESAAAGAQAPATSATRKPQADVGQLVQIIQNRSRLGLGE